METETIRQYIRDYSCIEGLQKAEHVCYRLYRQQGALWLSVGGCCCRLTGIDETFALGLLLYLYENSVNEQTAGCVLEDICGPLAEVQMGREKT